MFLLLGKRKLYNIVWGIAECLPLTFQLQKLVKEESAKCRACADDERWNFTLTNAQP